MVYEKGMERDMILEAINNYDVYNTATKSVLKSLVTIYSEQEKVSKISINALADLSKLSKQGVYNALKYIEKDNTVERFKKSGERVTYFKLNQTKLSEICEYHNKLEISKSILSKEK
jgi:Fe2+ or Zn2+ uptake regulation protein